MGGIPRRAKPKSTQLARSGDPLITGDGRIIKPDRIASAKDERKERGKQVKPHEFRPVRRIGAKELPATPVVMNGIGVVFMYTILGLSDREILDLLRLTQEQLNDLREHTAYAQLFSSVLHEFVNAESELIESRIAAYSHNALSRVADLVDNAEDEAIQFRASADILDRAGHSPKAKEQRGGLSLNDLRIVIVDGDAKVEVNIGTPLNEV